MAVKKTWHIRTMEYYSAIKKKSEVLPFTTTWMDPEGVMLSQRERKILCDLAYTWNVKNKENE